MIRLPTTPNYRNQTRSMCMIHHWDSLFPKEIVAITAIVLINGYTFINDSKWVSLDRNISHSVYDTFKGTHDDTNNSSFLQITQTKNN